ncbi:MAG: folylpolyglutamate synthase/dihydrofolate synthase family protein [Rikenellaceae bacterium]
MDYKQTLDFMFSSLPVFQHQGQSAYKPGIDSTINFLEKLGNPHLKFKTIHLAGTNGKGSCSHMLASVCGEAGLKTGLYTSPHLRDFRERIKINGVMIPENQVVSFIAEHKDKIKGLSFFEMCVGMCFDFFAREGVDIAIIETGLGGRLDSTNVVHPLVSIITNIGLDHTALLGNTLEQIAGEKAGIIKPNTPIIIGERNPSCDAVFLAKAKELSSPIYFAEDYAMSAECDLRGNYQKQNIAIVLKALDILQIADYKAVERGMKNVVKNTGLRGRWEIFAQRPLSVCDTGHNSHGLKCVLEQIKEQKFSKLYFVLGVVSDKDLDSILPLLPMDAHYIFTQASIDRALNINALYDKATEFGLQGEKVVGVNEAYARAKELAHEDDMIFVGGSTFTVADLDF